MKKILLALFLLAPIGVFAEDDFGVQVPEWSDFAPKNFIDVKQPKGILGKMNVVATYWYKRRVDFEESLAQCKNIEDTEERFACYEKLKVRQYKENSDYNARVEAQANSTSGIPEMNSRMDTMLPLNNYLNTFGAFQPNEFR